MTRPLFESGFSYTPYVPQRAEILGLPTAHVFRCNPKDMDAKSGIIAASVHLRQRAQRVLRFTHQYRISGVVIRSRTRVTTLDGTLEILEIHAHVEQAVEVRPRLTDRIIGARRRLFAENAAYLRMRLDQCLRVLDGGVDRGQLCFNLLCETELREQIRIGRRSGGIAAQRQLLRIRFTVHLQSHRIDAGRRQRSTAAPEAPRSGTGVAEIPQPTVRTVLRRRRELRMYPVHRYVE